VALACGCSGLRVLHCIPHVHLGGSDVGTLELVRSLNQLEGVEARLCVFLGREATRGRLRGIEDPILLDFRGSHRNPIAYLEFRRELRRQVREWRPAILHSHLWPACRWTGTALRDMDVPHVWHVRDTRDWLVDSNPRAVLLRLWTQRLARRMEPRCLAVSRAAAEHSARPLGLDETHFDIVSSGVDTTRFKPRERSARAIPRIGVVAGFRPEKGHSVFLRALRLLHENGIRFEVELAGAGSTLEASRQLCRELGLEKSMRFSGNVEDIPALLGTLDLLVLPSTGCEGLPLSVLEAMAAKVPVVATDVGGTREVVQTGTTGYLVRPGDAVSLAAGISAALDERGSASSPVDAAYQRVLKYHSNIAVAKRVQAIYVELLNR